MSPLGDARPPRAGIPSADDLRGQLRRLLDARRPAGEAIQAHDAFAAKETDAPLVIFSDEGHGAAKRENVVLQTGYALAFFQKHLKN